MYMNDPLDDPLDVNFLNDNHHLFLSKFSPEDLKSYIDINGDSSNYSFCGLVKVVASDRVVCTIYNT